MLGAVLVGKFVGDYAAITAVRIFGVHIGYTAGIIVTIAVFIYWERIHQRAQREAQKMNPSQTKLDRYSANEE